MSFKLSPVRHRERGVAAVEFALIASVFFTLLIGIMEMGRLLFYMNTAAEVTRLGARMAVVCDIDTNSAAVKGKMIDMLGILTANDITISYSPSSCTSGTCEYVTVSVSKTVDTFIPFVPLSIAMPSFSTTLPRESLSSASNLSC